MFQMIRISRSFRGFRAIRELLDKYQPRYFVHGHVHKRYSSDRNNILRRGGTTIINACGRYILEIPDQ